MAIEGPSPMTNRFNSRTSTGGKAKKKSEESEPGILGFLSAGADEKEEQEDDTQRDVMFS